MTVQNLKVFVIFKGKTDSVDAKGQITQRRAAFGQFSVQNLRINDDQIIFGNRVMLILNQEFTFPVLYIEQFSKSVGVTDTWPVTFVSGGRSTEQYRISSGRLVRRKSQGSGTHKDSFPENKNIY